VKPFVSHPRIDYCRVREDAELLAAPFGVAKMLESLCLFLGILFLANGGILATSQLAAMMMLQ
jgi:hypothetical protein